MSPAAARKMGEETLALVTEHILKMLRIVPDPLPSGIARRPPHRRRPLFVCLSGPQGSGKSTLNSNLERALAEKDIKVAVTGLDDVYLSFRDQEALRTTHPDNTLWQGRGVAGTHDIALGTNMFDELEEAQRTWYDSGGTSPSRPVLLPRYNKNANGGRGDRLPESDWPAVSAPVDVVIFEGWMNGFRALPEKSVEEQYRSGKAHYIVQHKLEHVLEMNSALRRYESEWWTRFDCCIHLRAVDYRFSYEWRWEAEQKAKGPLTREQVEKFVDRFMPMNELYMAELAERGMFGSDPRIAEAMKDRHLQVSIDIERRLVGHRVI
ncbi:hypothetical protein DFJ74DRAFT_666803 [Hyaloraphidium curvatum]|nr:hypothetical protein DFJ74DRAFT_666803 [Hyaloraphidium curvatum]